MRLVIGNIYLKPKRTELWTQNKFDGRYLQKDSLEHFETYSGS